MRLLLALCLLFPLVLRANDAELNRELERVYSRWCAAMSSHDAEGWHATTASYRQVLTRNLIVSQKQPFPDALFAIPLRPPDTGLLRRVKTHTKGPTANMLFFGRVDLGLGEENEIPENLLLLRFVREGSAWKFDTTRLINLSGLPKVRAELKSTGDSPYLDDEELLPSGVVPPTGQLCRIPEHVAMLSVISVGYSTTASLNGFAFAPVHNNMDRQLVIGGLNTGANALNLDIHKIELPKDKEAKRILQINAYVMTGYESRPSIRVYTWEAPATGELPSQVSLDVNVNQRSMKGQ